MNGHRTGIPRRREGNDDRKGSENLTENETTGWKEGFEAIPKFGGKGESPRGTQPVNLGRRGADWVRARCAIAGGDE